MNNYKFSVEFTINVYGTPVQVLKDSLVGLGNDFNLQEKEENGRGSIIKIHIHTNDPYLVFDTCSQFGRLKSVKVEELKEVR
jgi:dihydroxyacetone kinase-like predicted kinase